MDTEKLVYHDFGKAQEVLSLKKDSLPGLSDNQVLIEMRNANINPSDVGMIGGSYGKLKKLPAVAGREGVGEIIQSSNKNSTFGVGDLVKLPEDIGAWQSHLITNTRSLYKVPNGISPDQAATGFINPPTAWMLLREFRDLKHGDWIVQNAGNSSVGVWISQIASCLGIKTISLVRRAELEKPLLELGAEHVFVDDDDAPAKIREATTGSLPLLSLNSIGGQSVARLIKSTAEGGVCVTFGGMVGDPIRFPTRYLIFNDIELRGFWLDKWIRNRPQTQVHKLYNSVFEFASKNGLRTPIQNEYPLSEFNAALSEFSKPGLGKTLFKG